MKVDLDKKDLVNLVRGTIPSYDAMESPLIKPHGEYTGGFADGWQWNSNLYDVCNEDELLGMYYVCKDSGFNF